MTGPDVLAAVRAHWDDAVRGAEHLRDLAGLGVTHVQLGVGDGSKTDVLELIGERIIPAAARL